MSGDSEPAAYVEGREVALGRLLRRGSEPGGASDAEEERALERAFGRTTHLAVGAHPDDLEILAAHGILACHRSPNCGFFGVVVTDGRGSARGGPYVGMSDEDLRARRRQEQLAAARIGNYAGLVLLEHSSAQIKEKAANVVEELAWLLGRIRPEIVYTHSPLDQHGTHVAVCLAVVEAARRLAPEARPKELLGGEVWGSLDFLEHGALRELDVSADPHLQAALLGVFDSQIAGGKRYDLATLGRRRAQATFRRSHEVDEASGIALALDLTPLLLDPSPSPRDYVARILEESAAVALERIERSGG